MAIFGSFLHIVRQTHGRDPCNTVLGQNVKAEWHGNFSLAQGEKSFGNNQLLNTICIWLDM